MLDAPGLFSFQSLHDSNLSFDSSRSSLSLSSSSSSLTTTSPWRRSSKSNSNKLRKRAAGVTFAPLQDNDICDILDRSEFSQEEIEACWWGPQELDIIRENKYINDADDNAMLEQSSNGSSSREYVRYMLEQQLQLRRSGIQDPSGLSIISRSCSKQSRKSAEQRATRHAEYMREEYFSGMH